MSKTLTDETETVPPKVYKNLLHGTGITIANLVLLVGLIVQQARWQQSIDGQIKANSVAILKHTSNKDEHMPFPQKIELFVPRTEIEKDFKTLKEDLDEIKGDLKAVLKNVGSK